MTQANRVSVAIDVGGTGIKCGLVDGSGALVHAERHQTPHGPAAVLATIGDVGSALMAKASADGRTPVAVGVVIPGVVDETQGIAVWSANLGLRDAAIGAALAQRLGCPVAIGHDVRAGALAEARLGAGRGAYRMLFIAIGTGIAGGYVVGGRVDPGAHGAAGEIGHIVVRPAGLARECGCGGYGCLEAHASAAAIGRAYRAATQDQAGEQKGAKQVAQAVVAGDPIAERVWRDAVHALADGLLTGVALYDPELIVLGGGLAEAGDLLLDPLRAALMARVTFHRVPRLARAQLGDEAGCLGAGLLAWDAVA